MIDSKSCRIAQNFIGVQFAGVRWRPACLRAVGPRNVSKAAVADVCVVKARHAAILAVLTGQQGQQISDSALWNAAQINNRAVPAAR